MNTKIELNENEVRLIILALEELVETNGCLNDEWRDIQDLSDKISNAPESRRKEMERDETYANLKCPTCGDPEFNCHHDEDEE